MQIGHLKKGLNPPSVSELAFGSPYLTTAIKTGIITGVIGLAVSTPNSSNLTHNSPTASQTINTMREFRLTLLGFWW